MNNHINQALSSAILTLMRPLVRILLRNGIAFGTFSELAKKSYVDVAFEEFAIPGKKQTASRVSVLTGLTRKETRRLQECAYPNDLGADERYNRAIRVISGWLNEPRFLGDDGMPKALPVDGDDASFASLVKEFSGDMPTQAMLTALTEAGSVESNDGLVRLIKHAYIPGNDSVDKINILGADAGELIATIDHNLTAEDADLRFQRKVTEAAVKPEVISEFRRLSARKAQALLEELDHWLSLHLEHDKHHHEIDTPLKRVSLGIYYFEGSDSEEEQS